MKYLSIGFGIRTLRFIIIPPHRLIEETNYLSIFPNKQRSLYAIFYIFIISYFQFDENVIQFTLRIYMLNMIFIPPFLHIRLLYAHLITLFTQVMYPHCNSYPSYYKSCTHTVRKNPRKIPYG